MGGRDSVVFSLCVDDWEDGIRSDVMGVIDRKYITESSVFFFFFLNQFIFREDRPEVQTGRDTK